MSVKTSRSQTPTTRLERRVEKLERDMKRLSARSAANGAGEPWFTAHAGKFANDPIFDEIVRLGRQYRQSQRPPSRRTKRARSRH